jgi:hypothetical protein
MAGNTGKMTREQIAQRGPRMAVLNIFNENQHIGTVIAQEGSKILRADNRSKVYRVSLSYNLRYLMGVARFCL